MPQRCSVCRHPKRDQINRDLLSAKSTLLNIAESYGLTKSSLDRHKANHLKVSLEAAHEAKNALAIVGYAQDLYERSRRILERAELALDAGEGSPASIQAAAASLRELRGSVELLAKLVVSAPPENPTTENSWIDLAITAELEALRPPELPAGPALGDGIDDAVIVQEPD